MRRLMQAMATLIVLMVSAELSYARTTPAQKCAVAKNKAAAKKIVSKLKCNQTAISKGVAVDPACLTDTEVKFNTAIMKIEAAGGCAVIGDANAIEAAVDACVSNMVALTPVTTTTSTTTTTVTTTTLFPLCLPGAHLADKCGSCGSGFCANLCGPDCHDNELACVAAFSENGECSTGSDCASGLCAVFGCSDCGASGISGCATPCP
jgi:hypothetical protein